MKITTAHTQVQGMDAPDQIIRALRYFNERGEVQAIVILRGGGSADDLSCFNDEKLVREIAASRIPVVTGIGHEVDESLADLAADIRASTPSNAAEMLTPDRAEEKLKLERNMRLANQTILQEVARAKSNNQEKVQKISHSLMTKYIEPMLTANENKLTQCLQKIQDSYNELYNNLQNKMKLLEVLNPEKVLAQGYAILNGKISPGELLEITTCDKLIEAEIKKIKERN